MEVWLGGSFLPLLLLAWLRFAGLTHQISATINVPVRLDLVFQCLVETGSKSTAGVGNLCESTPDNGEEQNKGDTEMQKCCDLFIFTSVNITCTGMCRMENTKNMSENRHSEHGTVSQPGELVIAVEYRFQIWSENLTVHGRCNKSAGLEVENQPNTGALQGDCTNFTSHSVCAAKTVICRYRFRRTENTGNSMQRTVPTCAPEALQTNDTKKETWTGLKFLLGIIIGFATGTLIYVPVIGLLLWQCRRKRKGKFTSRQAAEGNQLSTAAPVTGTKDLTYANLKFEKKGTKPTSSDVVYTEIKPSQQKQSGGDAGAANAGVDVSPEGESK